MKTGRKDTLLLLGLILVGVMAFAGIFLGVASLRREVSREVVILPAATPVDEIVPLGYKTHFTGMFVEMFMGAESRDAISCTAGCVITPTGTYQPLESGGNVTCTLATAGMLGRYTGERDTDYTDGSFLWLVNETDTTIIVSEGATAELTGSSVSLGFSDTLTLFFDGGGTHWVELSESNN